MKKKFVRKLFKTKKIYDLKKTDELFINAMRENAIHHYKNCSEYKQILDNANFDPDQINTMEDVINLPFLPTIY